LLSVLRLELVESVTCMALALELLASRGPGLISIFFRSSRISGLDSLRSSLLVAGGCARGRDGAHPPLCPWAAWRPRAAHASDSPGAPPGPLAEAGRSRRAPVAWRARTLVAGGASWRASGLHAGRRRFGGRWHWPAAIHARSLAGRLTTRLQFNSSWRCHATPILSITSRCQMANHACVARVAVGRVRYPHSPSPKLRDLVPDGAHS
jgi:hypothetical protein